MGRMGIQPGKWLQFTIDDQPCEAQVKTVVWRGDDRDLASAGKEPWHDLLIVTTAEGSILIRRRLIDPHFGRDDTVSWHLTDSPERAAPLLDPANSVERRALMELGWWKNVARRV